MFTLRLIIFNFYIMGMSLNRAQLIGNLTRDPEIKQIPGGQTVATFGLATNFTWNDQSGNRQTKVEFHNIVAWRKLAEICGQYLRKGSKVFIEGRIQTRDWEAPDGSKRYRTEIIADNMIMLDKKGDFGGTYAGADGATSGSVDVRDYSSSRTSGGIKKSDSSDDLPAEDFPDSSGPVADLPKEPAVATAKDGGEVSIDDLPF
jgi:single-strand DNA-binding protein